MAEKICPSCEQKIDADEELIECVVCGSEKGCSFCMPDDTCSSCQNMLDKD